MVRKIVFYFESAFFSALQLFVLGHMLWSWTPTLAQAQHVAPVPNSKSLGRFLETYPAGVSESAARKQELWQRFGAEITAWRVVEDGDTKHTLAEGRADFAI